MSINNIQGRKLEYICYWWNLPHYVAFRRQDISKYCDIVEKRKAKYKNRNILTKNIVFAEALEN